MSISGAIAGGFVGTLVLTSALRAASELRLTRVDRPFLLGTIVTADRLHAKAIGYLLHFLAGFGFALIYYAFFTAIGRSGWMIGALLGMVQAVFASTALVNVVLPTLHPRMGTPVHRRHLQPTARTAGPSDAQLRAEHAGGHAADTHRLRRTRRRVRRPHAMTADTPPTCRRHDVHWQAVLPCDSIAS